MKLLRLAPLVAASALVAWACAAKTPQGLLESVRDGDLVFQTSRSSQSQAISLATKSRFTHMGIVYLEDGKPMVFEAVQPVRSTPLEAWAKRGDGGHIVVRRLRDAASVLTPAVLGRMREVGESFRGKSYDLAFAWDDSRLYCSELVYKIYARGAGIEIGQVAKMGDFDLTHPAVRAKLRERFGNDVPLTMPVISPQAMFDDPRLVTVYER